jgi:hypothetical protein
MNSLFLSAAALCVAASIVVAADKPDTRLYEMRIYHTAPGKLEDLHKRFRDHTLALFEKHGMESIGYWTPLENAEGKLIFVLRYPNREAREKSWKAFLADPDWQSAAKESEKNGKLGARVETFFMVPTDYSPEIKAMKSSSPRVFELRDYTASAGNLAALDSRFRDHTVKLFSKHGMQHVAYWHLAAGEKNADRKLIYILSHKSQEAGLASFGEFRKDPDWVKARAASEQKAGGSLTEGGMAGVKSTYMQATDYSPTK